MHIHDTSAADLEKKLSVKVGQSSNRLKPEIRVTAFFSLLSLFLERLLVSGAAESGVNAPTVRNKHRRLVWESFANVKTSNHNSCPHMHELNINIFLHARVRVCAHSRSRLEKWA